MGVYYLTSQPMEATRFAMFLLISVLTALVSQSFGLLVGAAFNVEVRKKPIKMSQKHSFLYIIGRRISRTNFHDTHGIILRIFRKIRRYPVLFELVTIRKLRKIQLRRHHGFYIRFG